VNPQIIELATELVTSLLTPRSRSLTRWAVQGLGFGIAGLGAIYLTIAADLALAEILSPALAAAAVGGGLILLALILIVAASRRSRKRQAELPLAALTELASGFLGQFEETVQKSPKTAAATAFAAGCVIGSSTELQRNLHKLMP
jgi:hypothetical protein